MAHPRRHLLFATILSLGTLSLLFWKYSTELTAQGQRRLPTPPSPSFPAATPMVLSTTEGTVPFTVAGEEFQTWYKIFGHLTDSSLPPVIGIHGGPGLVSNYLSPLQDLVVKNDSRPVILYDQLGNGKSSHIPEKPSEFFTVRLYVDELENLISKLGIKEYHLLGHSWGGPLAAELEVERRPAGLKSLILSNSLAEMRLASQSMRERVETLDNADEVLAAFKNGFEDPLALRKANQALHENYALKYFKERPIPDDLDALAWIFGDEERGIKGDNTVTLKMTESKTWSIIDRIHLLRVPVLLITATDDMIQGYASEPFFWALKRVKWINLEHSSHLPFWEERENYMRIVEKWLDGVDSQK